MNLVRSALIGVFISNSLFLYSQQLQEEKLPVIFSGEATSTEIPVIIHRSEHVVEKTTLPEKFDLRDNGNVTPVKNQSSCGCCWAFASMGSIESNLLLSGLGTSDWSEQHMRNCHHFVPGGCTSGNYQIALSYLVRGDGPIAESLAPYNINSSACVENLVPGKLITGATFLPNNKSAIKEYIMENGGVYAGMTYESYAFTNLAGSPYINTYFYNGTDETNHAVLVIGWDDTKLTKGGTGAWIAKNSWGTNWGESGYFYVAYNDSKFLSSACGFNQILDYKQGIKIYGNDDLGWTSSIGYKSETAFGLSKFEIGENQKIKSIGTYLNTDKSWFKAEIFLSKKDNELSGLIGTIKSPVFEYAGYYTLDFPEPIRILKGENVFVKIEYNTPAYSYPVPAEKAVENYAQPNITTNSSWVSPDGLKWEALGANINGKEKDLCMKLIAYNDTTALTTDAKNTINVYPNPARAFINIEMLYNGTDEGTIKLFDFGGREVIAEQFIKKANSYLKRIDLKDLSAGVYYLKIESTHYSKKEKIIVLK